MSGAPTQAALLELASRVEAASGPDRELDAAIALTQPDRFFNAGPLHPGARDRIGEIVGSDRCVPGNGSPDWLVPRYTASLDIAMTLVPKGLEFTLHHWRNASKVAPYLATAKVQLGSVNGLEVEADCCLSPALALTAAALRARAAQGDPA